MLRKLVVLHHMPTDYNVNNLIRFLIGMFNDARYRKILLEKYNLEVITTVDVQSNLNMDNGEFVEFITNKESCANLIILGIQPGGFLYMKKISNLDGIKLIAWQDDLHYFSKFSVDEQTSIQKYVGKFTSEILDKMDYLITPSAVYIKNLELENYYGKVVDLFYCLNPDWFDIFKDKPYENRLDKIILSGAVGGGYKSRIMFNGLKSKSAEFNDFIYKLEHPTKKKKSNMFGLNYYNKLSEFKGAFVGHYDFPINFCLAKHIEVLMAGCLGFYEPNPLLQTQLGLKEFEHYVPCYKDGNLIEDIEFYKNWIQSSEGKDIAKRGQEYVMENFGSKQIDKLFLFLQNC